MHAGRAALARCGGAHAPRLLWYTRAASPHTVPLVAMQMQPASARHTRTVAIDRALVQRAEARGSPAGIIEGALHTFLEHPDLEVPREPPAPKNLQVVRLDVELLLRVKLFALDQHAHRGKRVTIRAIVEEVLRAHLDALDHAATQAGEQPSAPPPPPQDVA